MVTAQTTPLNVLVLVDKPHGLTSHDVVSRCRRAFHTRRVGHAGTLDPMATGLLAIGVNRATKTLTYLVGLSKTYAATIRLGSATTTDDADGEITTVAEPARLTSVSDAAIKELIATQFTGSIAQRPSSVSAIKINGERAYAKVRRGETVAIPSRQVTIDAFEVNAIHRGTTAIDLDVVVRCSSGTYIRALARDIGATLQIGGHLTALRRTQVGPFHIADAVPLAQIEALGVAAQTSGDELAQLPAASILSLSDAMSAVMNVRHLTDDEARALRFGQRILASPHVGIYAGVDEEGHLVAVLEDHGAEAVSKLVIPEETAQ